MRMTVAGRACLFFVDTISCRRLSGFGSAGPVRRKDPWKQFMDAAAGMDCDGSQHGAEIEFRVDSIKLGRTDERIDRHRAFAVCIRSGRKMVLAVMQIFA